MTCKNLPGHSLSQQIAANKHLVNNCSHKYSVLSSVNMSRAISNRFMTSILTMVKHPLESLPNHDRLFQVEVYFYEKCMSRCVGMKCARLFLNTTCNFS